LKKPGAHFIGSIKGWVTKPGGFELWVDWIRDLVQPPAQLVAQHAAQHRVILRRRQGVAKQEDPFAKGEFWETRFFITLYRLNQGWETTCLPFKLWVLKPLVPFSSCGVLKPGAFFKLWVLKPGAFQDFVFESRCLSSYGSTTGFSLYSRPAASRLLCRAPARFSISASRPDP
jgi:hypothetical protein